jgi:hypothetical protein
MALFRRRLTLDFRERLTGHFTAEVGLQGLSCAATPR